jgi:predicted metal-dependent phosphoesterase TrpH
VIDLHTHSNASDGTDSPAELIRRAAAVGLTAIAITDHDTTGGWDEAGVALQGLSGALTLLRGTEFSCVYRPSEERRVSLHILGYLYDRDLPALRAERERLRADRVGRGQRIVQNLVEAGYPISWQRVRTIASGGVVGRPHIGQALVEAGVVPTVNDAFAELLASSSPYYVRKQDMDILDAIGLIAQAGGVSVIAHPWARRRGRVLTVAELDALVSAGLGGIEVDHPDHEADDRAALRGLASELDVIQTGSSDYHGTNKAIELGSESTGLDEFERLVATATGLAPIDAVSR